ncbi:Auxin efflux carrier [Macleaya cordata]|uniref:Auxin efflux carrier n=1 Tax=Macleaya cordata TaxID=56857 RepID=A0A200QWD0_MACCD|nr:Auxin efflux carrier [Macleaya cordata]
MFFKLGFQFQIVTQASVPVKLDNENQSFWVKLTGSLHQIVEELLAPPTIGGILGFLFGATPWLKNLIIGEGAPLRVIQDSIKLLGDGTIPCITLILGGNLTQGLRSARLKPMVIIGVIIVRFLILPVIGMGIVKAAGEFGFLPPDPLFRYVLMVQFAVPPAMNIGTMTQLFDVGQEECSVLFLWTYLVASLALTLWSSVYMYILF